MVIGIDKSPYQTWITLKLGDKNFDEGDLSSHAMFAGCGWVHAMNEQSEDHLGARVEVKREKMKRNAMPIFESDDESAQEDCHLISHLKVSTKCHWYM